ncbi:MAG: hypothetical protein RIT43_1394 [Bacteroidota bacterium]|jgi:uncharacterized protein (DUF2141 family)
MNFLFLLSFLFGPLPTSKVSLTVNVSGFSDNVGKSYIALYRPKDVWPEINKQFIGKVVAINGKTSTVKFDNLECGTYAVAVFHDRNNNGKLDKNMLGIPVERYGFSNNARETFSAPSFGSASVELQKDRAIAIFVK